MMFEDELHELVRFGAEGHFMRNLSHPYYQAGMKNQWRQGPIQSIICTPPHDRPIFSLGVGKNSFVTGSADHGLREYTFQNGKHLRELFNKKYGHKEWVTTCAYTPSGRIISGAMDSVVCLWDAKSVKCDSFLGHKASISKVMADDRIALSASYDSTVILWDVAKKSMSETLAHKDAVMEFEWVNSLLVTGDKSGVVAIWDLNKCAMVRATKLHKGSVSNIKFNAKNGLILTSGLNDGSLACVDMRTNSPIHHQMHHKGSLNWLKVVQESNLVLSCSADGSIKVHQLGEFRTLLNIDAGDMVFCVEQVKDVILSSTAKGNILAFDLKTGEALYGYGVMKKGGCRLLGLNAEKTRLVCAGEDQSATLLVFK